MRLWTCLAVFSLLFFSCASATFPRIRFADDGVFLNGTFPPGFQWGLATASYQIEGGWNEDGKGVNIWDTWSHLNVSPIDDGSTGDIACDSYHKYKEDVQLLKNMGAHFYRFSLSWSRILPLGTTAVVNQPGVDYYNALIDELLSAGIEPMITLYHWDLPQPLEDAGGWRSEAVIQPFSDFARLAYTLFGSRVKTWITFNEPWVICWQGYGIGTKAPGINAMEEGPYQCAHNLLKAHALAYRVYDNEFKAGQGGRVGITLDCGWSEPASEDAVDLEAAERALLFKHGWFGFPIYFGDYPEVMRTMIDTASLDEGRDRSRLPYFDAGWRFLLKGSSDFLGLNHYTSALTENAERGESGWAGDQNTRGYPDPAWPPSASVWLKVVPWGIRSMLNWLTKTYNTEILVTENGFSEGPDAGLQDTNRTLYYRDYINNVMKAVVLDGCNVTAYTAWSLIDNFEWARGYTERFGLHHVDFTDPERPRTAKDSVAALTKIFADNGFPDGPSEP